MAKCAKCGTTIKNIYYVDGKPYGSECFKSVMGDKRVIEGQKYDKIRAEKLAELKAKRELKYLEELENNKLRSEIAIECLKLKKMNKITNEYKLFLYKKAFDLYEKEGSFDNSFECAVRQYLITTNKDNDTYYRMYLDLIEDTTAIEEVNDLYMYGHTDNITEMAEAKIEELKTKYDYTIEVINETEITKIGDTTIQIREL